MQRKVYNYILAMIWLLLSSTAQADLSVTSQSWPTQLPESVYDSRDYYGNSQTSSFMKAVTADGSDSVSISDTKTINTVLHDNDLERWYIKAGMYKATTKLTGIKNKSSAPRSTYILHDDAKKANKDITGIQVGVGYIYERYRFDVDYIVGTDIEYNKTPLFTAGYPDITSKVSGQHLIANGYYEFTDIFFFRPFVGASLGLGMNKASVTFARMGGGAPALGTNGAGKPKTSIAFDYGMQFGARAQIYKTKFFASASYRYLSLGSVKWKDISEQLVLQGSRNFNGVSLDIMYLL